MIGFHTNKRRPGKPRTQAERRNGMYIRTRESPGLGWVGLPTIPQRPPKPLSLMFRSKVIPSYKDQNGKSQSTDCSVYIPSALRNQKEIDVLVFFHGDDSCIPQHNFSPYKVVKNFRLDDQVDQGQRKVALAVPVVHWKINTSTNIGNAWSAANLNAFVEEVLDQIGSCGVRPSLRRLILAGHSHAHAILTALANEFVTGVADTTKGALAKLAEVWGMDTTYGTHARALVNWANKLDSVKDKPVRFTLVLSKEGSPPYNWRNQIEREKVKLPKNLSVCKTNEIHCDLPSEFVADLLSVVPCWVAAP
jgi:hypothetical protein